MTNKLHLPEGIAATAEDYRSIQAPEHLHAAIMQKVGQKKSRRWLSQRPLSKLALATCTLALLAVLVQQPIVENQFAPRLPGRKSPLPSFAALSAPSMTTMHSIAFRTPGGIPTLGSASLRLPKTQDSIMTDKSEASLNSINNYSQVAVCA